jgi:hypothetical protein
MLKKLTKLRLRTKLRGELNLLESQHAEAISAWRRAALNGVDQSEERELAKFANSLQFKYLLKVEELRKIS